MTTSPEDHLPSPEERLRQELDIALSLPVPRTEEEREWDALREDAYRDD